MSVTHTVTKEELELLLIAIAPELRCIRDCRYTTDATTIIRPDDKAIVAADKILLALGLPT
jgi:hypothetical protein